MDREPVLWARPPEDVSIVGQHLLRIHTGRVAERMVAVLDGVSLNGVGLDSDRTTDLARVIGTCHDFGKNTEWFQEMLRGESDVERGDPLTYHSLLGALLTMYALETRGFGPVEQVLGGVVVMAHHSPMPNPAGRVEQHLKLPRDPSVSNHLTETLDRIDKQLANVRERVPGQAGDMIDRATDGAGSLDEFEQYVTSRSHVRTLHRSRLTRSIDEEFYGDLLLCYSALKLADTSHSAGVFDEDLLTSDRLDHEKLKAKFAEFRKVNRPGLQGDLDDLRTQAQDQISDRVELLCRDDTDAARVGSIWLPTGFGKTFGGLSAALEISDRMDKDRIIYALPFTSIIDQNSAVIEDVFDVKAGTSSMIIHHYLAGDDRRVRRDSAEQTVDPGLQFLLGGSWRAGCVVTTFVQLFESVIAPGQSQAPKVPAIRDSVVILDEPQELPPKLWPLIARIIEILADRFDTHVLFMTATQPRFFETHSDRPVVDLIDDPTPYIDFLANHPRVIYRIHQSVQRYVEADDSECEDELPLTYPDATEPVQETSTGKLRIYGF